MAKWVLGDKTGMDADRMFGQAVRTEIDEDMLHVPFTPGPAWDARHVHPLTSISAQEAAAALVNKHGAEKAAAWARALIDNVNIEARRNRATDAREAGL